ncbi:hypothetical protein I6E74_06795 [Salinibacterium sp. SWN139]|uniref:hypothetical protein n=1 Tax=Salinibacterium sp. SWN139 TaxID=2792055 RepID=UPI0018CEE8B5|nr:hypothetical protein [Salinibacterium sp. SWN139]MBH0053876.1 hypothetical protein [Salinibacterium sp. SWN139]
MSDSTNRLAKFNLDLRTKEWEERKMRELTIASKKRRADFDREAQATELAIVAKQLMSLEAVERGAMALAKARGNAMQAPSEEDRLITRTVISAALQLSPGFDEH